MDASLVPCQQTYDNYTFTPELFGFPITTTCADIDVSSDKTSPDNMFFNNNIYDHMAVPTLSKTEMGFRDLSGFSVTRVFEPGDQEISSGLMPVNYYPAYHDQIAANNWGLLQSKQVASVEEAEVKVGRYSVEERKGRILRYLKKRNQRNFNKTIKYACRKTLADKRVRVRGRFAKNNDPSEEKNGLNTSDQSFVQNGSCYDEMICSDDDWLQAAMAGLLYLPYLAGG
ncbi:hypothetical protein CASFOL_040536 [Castilleja foliolosa]|uniref:CCT domain-containing protein n=1 Tax=Castilleja foliolosa TaxID=1961234 RepID=A0ABD3BDF8_9LAMI